MLTMALLLLFSYSVFAGGWEPIGEDVEGNLYFIAPGTISYTENNKKSDKFGFNVLVQINYNEIGRYKLIEKTKNRDDSWKYKYISYVVAEFSFYRENYKKSYRINSSSGYAEDGTLVAEDVWHWQEYKPFDPKSMANVIYNASYQYLR